MKRCRTCGHEKPLDAFHLYRAGGTRRRGECKSCSAERSRVHQASARDGKIEPRKKIEPTGEKRACSRCRIKQDTSQFHRDRRRPGGLHPYCKTCRGRENTEYLLGGRDSWTDESDHSTAAQCSRAAS